MVAPLLFADTFYWVALLDRRDLFHQRVSQTSQSVSASQIVTTDEVLLEVLAAFSKSGQFLRSVASQAVRHVIGSGTAIVLPASRADFLAALALYEARPDKEYSLTDCRSMLVMWQLGIAEVLTHDRHFAQEGFTVLFP